MRISNLRVRNFRSIKDTCLDLAGLTCAVGHNNSGKSSLMMSLSLFVGGGTIEASDFYSWKEDVTIEGKIADISNADLSRLTAEQRTKIEPLIDQNKCLRLVRRYSQSNGATFRYIARVPKDVRLREDYLDTLLKGKTGKAVGLTMVAEYPELSVDQAKLTTQTAARELLGQYRSALPDAAFEDGELSLPTGIPESIAALLPEVIYIPAVQDVSDALKTKETASFGKIVRVLLDSISSSAQIKDINDSFSQLRTLLNRELLPDGTKKDSRINHVKKIESLIEEHLRQQFKKISLELEVPPPEMKAILGGTRIMLDDGIRSPAETKGDGVKRALTFALIRTYVHLRREPKQPGQSSIAQVRPYLMLFEEPELYLHPNAQRILYDSLLAIADEHQVCVSTHSPYFLSASCRGGFVRVSKPSDLPDAPPASHFRRVDLESLAARSAFQLLCYENNAAAFFSDRVVLVEGDSDHIYLKHIAKVLNSDWDFDARNITIIQTGGKGSLERYWKFFELFGIDVRIVADLDVLDEGFEKLRPTPAELGKRGKLVEQINAVIIANGGTINTTSSKASRLARSLPFIQQMDRVRVIVQNAANGGTISSSDALEMGRLLTRISTLSYCHILANSAQVKPQLDELIETLRERKVFVLSKGAIDEYYPPEARGDDKPSKALNACSLVKCEADALKCSPIVPHDGQQIPELQVIFSGLFGD